MKPAGGASKKAGGWDGAGAVPRGTEKAGHDTVATLVLDDSRGGLAAGCSTAGLPWKIRQG